MHFLFKTIQVSLGLTAGSHTNNFQHAFFLRLIEMQTHTQLLDEQLIVKSIHTVYNSWYERE